ncbi:MAG TPA: YetF domain-containing protein [Pyrinomonadaceae bacterium]|nr:YetF domain-containing protein [Pyrinomonadaceae bacterium]
MLSLIWVDWESVFVPSLSIFEVILRGSLIYLFLFVVLRVLRRGAGAIGISDLLVVVLIADAAQNALGSEYRSVTEGVVLVLTIVGWDYLFDWLGYRVPALRPVLRPPALLLIKNGKLQKRNMRKEMLSEEELLGELREQGVSNVEDVKFSFMESNGHISVVKKEKKRGA